MTNQRIWNLKSSIPIRVQEWSQVWSGNQLTSSHLIIFFTTSPPIQTRLDSINLICGGTIRILLLHVWIVWNFPCQAYPIRNWS